MIIFMFMQERARKVILYLIKASHCSRLIFNYSK